LWSRVFGLCEISILCSIHFPCAPILLGIHSGSIEAYSFAFVAPNPCWFHQEVTIHLCTTFCTLYQFYHYQGASKRIYLVIHWMESFGPSNKLVRHPKKVLTSSYRDFSPPGSSGSLTLFSYYSYSVCCTYTVRTFGLDQLLLFCTFGIWH